MLEVWQVGVSSGVADTSFGRCRRAPAWATVIRSNEQIQRHLQEQQNRKVIVLSHLADDLCQRGTGGRLSRSNHDSAWHHRGMIKESSR